MKGAGFLSLSVKDRSGDLSFMDTGKEKAELREPLVYQEKDWQSLAAFLEKEPVDTLHITGILPRLEPWIERSLAEPVKKDVPMIMVRIVHLGQFLESFRAKADFTVKIQVEDERIPENYRVLGDLRRKRSVSESRKAGRDYFR